jgi:hypothetical protein
MGRLWGEGVTFSKLTATERCLTVSLLELFCDVDDFWQCFQPHWQQDLLRSGAVPRLHQGQLSVSEVMTIMIHFHQSYYRHFKAYYTEDVPVRLRRSSPTWLAMDALSQMVQLVLLCFCKLQWRGKCTWHSWTASSCFPLFLTIPHKMTGGQICAQV